MRFSPVAAALFASVLALAGCDPRRRADPVARFFSGCACGGAV
jgi:hypothetical protein